MLDLIRALARADELIAERFADENAVRALLRAAADESRSPDQRRADLRLLGAIFGEALLGPRIVHLDIVGQCNANCVYCRDHSPYITDREPWRLMEMPYETASRLIDEAEKIGAELMPIVGAGENLLHTRFTDLVEQLKTKPFRFEIFTNGLLWTDELIDRLAAADNAMIVFSLSAASAKNWAAYRPEMSPALFDKIEETIRKLVERRVDGMRVGIVHVLNKKNVREVLPMIRHAIDLGVDEVEYKLTEINEASLPLKPGVKEIESIGLELLEARRLASLAGVDIHDNIEVQLDVTDIDSGLYTKGLYDRLPCLAGYEMIRVRRDGQVSFCCALKFYADVNKRSLKDIWYGEPLRSLRRTAVAFPDGANAELPDGSHLRDEQCDYCYNYILNELGRRRAEEAEVRHLLPGER